MKHIDHHYGVQVAGQPTLTDLRRLRALQPYFALMEPLTLRQFAEHCSKMGWIEWRRTHLDPLLRGTQFQLHQDLSERMTALDHMLSNPRLRSTQIWAEGMVKQDGRASDALEAVDGWIRQSPTIDRLKLAVDVVIHIGQRAQLSVLESWRELLRPDGDAILDDAIFAVKRRTLQ
jgi:hypothetical protein